MGTASHSLQPIRFGAFEVDLRSGELRKHGLKIKLQEQPFEILTMLLEHPGEVVTREELCKKLWSEGTFVDFDNSLNTGINKIREALGDSADNPRFVETLPRRGYRFIYPVNVGAGLKPAPTVAPVSPPALWAAMRTSPLQWRIAALAAVALIASVAFIYWFTRPLPAPRATNAVRIARLHGGTWFFALLTDGVRIYFTDWLGDRSVIMQVPVAGGEAVPIPTPFRYALALDISVKRSEFLVGGGDSWELEMPLWVVPIVGGSPRRLGEINAEEALWSPDGENLWFCRGADFYLAKSDGTDPRKLASVPGHIYFAN
ncbi:MAG TPA: winged helix-turn-helix domain-containing protein [Terriglobia bacterium]|nr:winged helix-turn-helix domain-containing protein [Terriglobia bacterium]